MTTTATIPKARRKRPTLRVNGPVQCPSGWLVYVARRVNGHLDMNVTIPMNVERHRAERIAGDLRELVKPFAPKEK